MVAGTWHASLAAPTGAVVLVLHLETVDGGDLRGSLDSPSRGVEGIVLSNLLLDGDILRFDVPAVAGQFEGTVAPGAQRIEGRWKQPMGAADLVWHRGAAPTDLLPQRPQTPTPPFPYSVEEIAIDSASGIRLACTANLPPADGPMPGVVLLTVAGENDRDQSFAGHHFFAVIADHLARHGVASLRCDDRGVGGSTGSLYETTYAALAQDALAMRDRLASLPSVDAARVGFAGNSEGAAIGPMAAVADDRTAFVVLLAGPGLLGREAILGQTLRLAAMSGYNDAQKDALREQADAFFAVLDTVEDDDDAMAQLAALEEAATVEPPRAALLAGGDPEARRRLFVSPWYRSSAQHDAAAVLRQLRIPVLALTGSLDPVLPADQNLPPILEALIAAPTDDVTVEVLPGVNHLLQPAETGHPAEYARIDTTVAPAVLRRLSDWIGARFIE